MKIKELESKMKEGAKLLAEAREKASKAKSDMMSLEAKFILGTITDEERKTLATLKGLI